MLKKFQGTLVNFTNAKSVVDSDCALKGKFETGLKPQRLFFCCEELKRLLTNVTHELLNL